MRAIKIQSEQSDQFITKKRQHHKSLLKFEIFNQCQLYSIIAFLILLFASVIIGLVSKPNIVVIMLNVGDNRNATFDSLDSIFSYPPTSNFSNFKLLLYFHSGHPMSRLKYFFRLTNYHYLYPFQIQYIQWVISQHLDYKYFFLTTTKWQFDNFNFLPELVQMIESEPNVHAVYLSNEKYNFTGKNFSFSPGLYKISDYQNRTFASIVENRTFFTSKTEQKLSDFYTWNGFKTLYKNEEGFRLVNQEIIKKVKPQSRRDIIYNLKVLLENATQFSGYYGLTEAQIKQLPFCLVVTGEEPKGRKQTLQSLKKLNYTNYKIIQQMKSHSYFDMKKTIKNNCLNNSYIMFVNYPLLQNSLMILNQKHQKYSAWVIYNMTQSSFEIYSFLYRVYDLLESNDFDKSNKQYLQKGDRQVQALGFLQLCLDTNIGVSRQNMTTSEEKAYFSFSANSNSPFFNRSSYNYINNLAEDYAIDSQMHQIVNSMKNQFQSTIMPMNTMSYIVFDSIDRRQSIFLPYNHSIFDIQLQLFDQRYKILQKKEKNQQIRFCITILSHNNVQNGRYWKIIESIVRQDYQNYHIVFIDDNSDDGNMQKTIQYFKKIGFPLNKVTFIQNKVRAFATYNIVNAAYNYCQQDEVQMILDGDDQVIGRYAFQTLSSAYFQQSEIWVAYSSYKSSYYRHGLSHPVYNQQSYINPDGSRRMLSAIGAIRTWRVKLIQIIPGYSHKYNGQWLNTLYDDALEHPILQFSTEKKIRYIPESLYEYNVNYGDNDDSTPEKISYRDRVHKDLIKRKPQTVIQTLKDREKDPEIERQLKNDEFKKYIHLKP